VNNLADRNGRVDFNALKNAPQPTDFLPNATVDTTLASISTRAAGAWVWDTRDWRDNRAQEWNLTIERQVMKDTALRLSYIGTHGTDLEQHYDLNCPESEWNYQARTGLARPSDPDLRRVNPDWTMCGSGGPLNHTGFSNAQSLQAEVERRYSNGLGFQWFYAWTHAMTTNDTGGFDYGPASFNATSGGFGVPENTEIFGAPNLSYDQRLRLGYFNSREVPAHRVRYNGIYTLPFGRNQKYGGNISRGLDAVVGGWELAFIGDWRSGNWSSVDSGRYLFGDPTLSADERIELTLSGKRRRLWFRGDFPVENASDVDTAKLEQLVPADRTQRVLRRVGDKYNNQIPQVLADGSVRYTNIADNVNWNARNFFRGPGAWNVDFSVFKHFKLTERLQTRLTADFFNVFNHPNDLNPDSTTGLQDLS
jgi:hypothetical protein